MALSDVYFVTPKNRENSPPGGGGLPYEMDGDARRLAFSFRVAREEITKKKEF